MAAKKETRRTGEIWEASARARRAEVLRLCTALESEYGPPLAHPPEDPLDTMIRLIISTRTRGETTRSVFDALKRKYPDFESLKRARTGSVQKILKPAGLSTTKAGYVKDNLYKVKQNFGQLSLEPLRGMPAGEAYEYLVSLAGVSDKVAACTMLFALDIPVLPVDTHVQRIAGRLGWGSARDPHGCRMELEELVPPERRHAFHVNCIAHGRARCRGFNPLCPECPILRYCRYAKTI